MTRHRIYKEDGKWIFEWRLGALYRFEFDTFLDAVAHFVWSVENGWPYSE